MLKISSLTFAFHPPFHLFENANFTIQPGEIAFLEGPNGCGKSTFLSLIAGMRSANSGDISFEPLQSSTPQNRRHYIEYLSPDSNGLYMKLDAMQNLKFWLGLRQQNYDPKQLRDHLAEWQLGDPLISQGFPVQKFSTGMKRRLALARVFASQSPCLVLDEPLNGLDQKGCELFVQKLYAHKNRGGMAIVVCHNAFLHYVERSLLDFSLSKLRLQSLRKS